ncbi:MAG: lipoprotein insertase outer membrane protein LolB [Pseudomonadales bacterium]|jgi:outer membrane lipoprotein LolB|tara:strand:+ start:2896 stop:3582 length:687 start_codon:yes stop_codon:yes gene_type:complete
MNSKATSHFKSLTQLTSLGIICIAIAACSTAPATKNPPIPSHAYAPFSYKQAELAKLVQWDVEGKLAVYANDKNNSGLLTWRQRSAYFDLLINGPLGSGQLHIEGSPGLAIATSSKGQVEAESIEALFKQEFGWHFPMQELRYWARGIPHPDTRAKVSYNSEGEAATIEQAGWQVTYHSYSKVTGLPMPKKIEIIGTDIRLVLVLKSWFNLFPFPRLNPSFAPIPSPE